MQRISLNGKWHVSNSEDTVHFAGRVPGDVYADLLKAHKIPDPYYRMNDVQTDWIGETDWLYSRTFRVSRHVLSHQKILLFCDGLDTLATIWINGRKIAETDNMFRSWEFDVKPLLKQGTNAITIRFGSAMESIRHRMTGHDLPQLAFLHQKRGGNWLRKQQCNFGWDWGPALVTCGIWRDIGLIAFSGARMMSTQVVQHHRPDRACLDVRVFIEAPSDSPPTTLEATLSKDNVVVAEMAAAVRKEHAECALEIQDPELWWPNGLGPQPLYELETRLLSSDGQVLERQNRRIGLRTLALERKDDAWGESFRFVVNGVPFFAKGANWIPTDAVLSHRTAARYSQLLSDVAAANMNMLRVWGGGIYEDDLFYDLCDEKGICVWQDFMFACATYPTYDKAYINNVTAEITDVLQRLGHHACIALWCGNNELEMGHVSSRWSDRTMAWRDYRRLFDKVIPSLVRQHCPDASYWPSSPHTPGTDRIHANNETRGDAHFWDVWHGRKPFEWYRTSKLRFCSEFGFQSFPSPKSVDTFCLPDDRNIGSRVMEHHQRNWEGNTTIIAHMLEWFRMPKNFEMTLWLSQVVQGLAMKFAVEHWRRLKPRTMGALYWQLNDCWPAASWSSIDSSGRWKALHYMARRFFAPLLLSAVEDPSTDSVTLYVDSDLRNKTAAIVEWEVTTPTGKVLGKGSSALTVRGGDCKKVSMLRLRKHVQVHGPHGILIWYRLLVDGRCVSEDTAFMVRPKHISLPRTRIVPEIRQTEKRSFELVFKVTRPAFWVWADAENADIRCSDNFFHLHPRHPRVIRVECDRDLSVTDLRDGLTAFSLADTYD